FNVQRDDTQNYTITNDSQTFVISQNDGACNVLFSKNSPITSPETFIVYTDCNSAATLYRGTTVISNNSVQSLSPGTYNFSVERTDTANYSIIYNSELFTVN
ncbi:MAG: hypothetical protein ACP5D2_04995, partial [Candidatus Nanoarchaeia archaeon]